MTTQQTQQSVFRRPADNNYQSISALLDSAQSDMNNSRELKTPSSSILFAEDNDTLCMSGDRFSNLSLTHWPLSQVATMAKLPLQVIERLDRRNRLDLVVDNLNELFPIESNDMKTVLIQDSKNEYGETTESKIRAVNGSAYSRLWDYEVFSEVEDLIMPQGFTPTIPGLMSFRNQFMRNDHTALYRGDQSSFGFFFAQTEADIGKNLGGLWPGVMVWNSEVGARSFGFHTFYYHLDTGAIIIWTPAKHKRKRFVHRGNIKKGFGDYMKMLDDTAYNFESRYQQDIVTFTQAAGKQLGTDVNHIKQRLQEVLDMSATDAGHIAAKMGARRQSTVWDAAIMIAQEAGMTSRAESLVDKSLVATKLIKKLVK